MNKEQDKNIISSENGITVLSLFDGISCGRVALERAGIKVNKYYAYEIDEYAIKVSKDNWCDIEHFGNVVGADFTTHGKIDLLIGGSPCQDISNLNKSKNGLNGEKSRLFYEYLRALQETNPTYFLFENVVGKKESTEEISKLLGVKPILINSSLVSGQKRRRYYWTNIPQVTLPKDKNILLKDVLQKFEDAELGYLSDSRKKWLDSDSGKRCVSKKFANIDGNKSQCLTARSEGSWNCQYVTQNGVVRHLTPIEYERLQTLDDNYTSCIPVKERYKCLGNGWTVDVIAHILKHLK